MAKLTSKRELFARYFAETGNATEAHKRAGYGRRMSDKTRHEAASRLLADSTVRARVLELQSEHAERHAITVDDLISDLDADRRFAREQENPAAAVSATMGKARILGFLDRGRPIKFELPKITDDASALDAMRKLIEGMAQEQLTVAEVKGYADALRAYKELSDTFAVREGWLEVAEALRRLNR